MSKACDKYEEKVSNERKKPSLLLYVLNLSSLNKFGFIKKNISMEVAECVSFFEM